MAPGCLEEVDTVTGDTAAYITLQVYTRSGSERLLAAMPDLLRKMVAAQEEYRGSHGRYAPELESLAGFADELRNTDIRFAAVADGWSARVRHRFSARECSVAVGTTPPDPGTVSGQVHCTGDPGLLD